MTRFRFTTRCAPRSRGWKSCCVTTAGIGIVSARWCFPRAEHSADYEHLRLDADAGVAAGSYVAGELSETGVTLATRWPVGGTLERSFRSLRTGDEFELAGDLELVGCAGRRDAGGN